MVFMRPRCVSAKSYLSTTAPPTFSLVHRGAANADSQAYPLSTFRTGASDVFFDLRGIDAQASSTIDTVSNSVAADFVGATNRRATGVTFSGGSHARLRRAPLFGGKMTIALTLRWDALVDGAVVLDLGSEGVTNHITLTSNADGSLQFMVRVLTSIQSSGTEHSFE